MAVDLSAFPLPTLVMIVGPISPPQELLPGQDRVNWWGYTIPSEFVAIPPEVVEDMTLAEGDNVWNPQPGEHDPLMSVERVRLALNAAAERMAG